MKIKIVLTTLILLLSTSVFAKEYNVPILIDGYTHGQKLEFKLVAPYGKRLSSDVSIVGAELSSLDGKSLPLVSANSKIKDNGLVLSIEGDKSNARYSEFKLNLVVDAKKKVKEFFIKPSGDYADMRIESTGQPAFIDSGFASQFKIENGKAVFVQ